MGGKARPQSRAIALAAIASGDTQREAATKAKCAETTVHRWTASADFRAELAAIQARRRDEAEQLLASEIRKSLDTIREIRDDPDQEAGVRLRASVELLDRVGIVKTDRSEVQVYLTNQDVSDEDIDAELARMAAMRERSKPKEEGEDDAH